MTRAYKSDRHTALNSNFPADGFERLLRTGAVTGPHRKTRPLTLTWQMKLCRWVRNYFQNRR